MGSVLAAVLVEVIGVGVDADVLGVIWAVLPPSGGGVAAVPVSVIVTVPLGDTPVLGAGVPLSLQLVRHMRTADQLALRKSIGIV